MRVHQDEWREAGDPDVKHAAALAFSQAATGYLRAAERNDLPAPEDVILGLKEGLAINDAALAAWEAEQSSGS